MTDPTYRDYVADDAFISEYSEYQWRYATTLRESDRVLIDIVRETVGTGPATLLDIGCSTGNLLRHLKQLVPGLTLTGGDLTPRVLEDCRRDPQLAGVTFEELDILDLPRERFDVVVANAILYLMRDGEFERAAASVAGALRPGGAVVVFDLFHEFEQELAIKETSRTHPSGLVLHFRPFDRVRAAFADAGLGEPEFRPFRIPIDLPRPADDGEIISYTVPAASGERLLFRGTLYQPWCHVVARKSG